MNPAISVKKARMRCKISQMELASRTGVDQGYISRVENHTTKMSVGTAVKLASALGVDSDDLTIGQIAESVNERLEAMNGVDAFALLRSADGPKRLVDLATDLVTLANAPQLDADDRATAMKRANILDAAIRSLPDSDQNTLQMPIHRDSAGRAYVRTNLGHAREVEGNTQLGPGQYRSGSGEVFERDAMGRAKKVY